MLLSPRRTFLARTVAAVVATTTGVTLVVGAAAAEPSRPPSELAVTGLAESETGRWVVQLAEPSLAAQSVAATTPGPQLTDAGKVDVTAPASRSYLDHLADRQASLAAMVGEELGRTVDVEQAYRNVLNAIVVTADAAEAEAIVALPGVAAVHPEVTYELTTDASHDLIGSASIWDGDTGPDLPTRGEGTIVGVLDTGINPGHPSFAATDGEGYTHTNPFGPGSFVGVCDPDHPNHEDICNDKLVGAWSFVSTPSAVDGNGHGSHTASTAAGNRHEVTLTHGDDEITRTVQGVAPRGNLIAYRVCITTCPITAILAGIDQAVADGVDVLNYSISGADSPWANSVSRAFLEAFGAGIFVSTSAGNSGPGAGSVAHTAPWNASVAASTTDRIFANTLSVLGPDPAPAVRAWPGFGPGNLADIDAELRYSGQVGAVTGCSAFPADGFAGAIALIPTGTCAFATKVNNAANAGAQAAVLFEREAGPPVFLSGLESTTIPAVSVDETIGEALQELVTSATEPVTVRLGAATELVRDDDYADIVTWFSSRGPSNFDLLAPTFAAPGVNVLAAYRDADGDPVQYNVIRGTSMAAPHATGAGALLSALHPEWSPAQIRSALAGTANPAGIRTQDGVTPADPFDTGSGRMDLDAAGRVGLVLDESYDNMLAANPATGGDPRTLNVPYLVNQQCTQVCSWTRVVASVADVAASYTVAVDAPAGMTVSVAPAAFTLAPGGTQQLTITVDVTGSSGGAWAFADLRLSTDDTHVGGAVIAAVHYPLAVIPVAPAISIEPDEIEVAQKPDRESTRALSVRNQGNGPLEWQLTGDPATCDAPAEVPWLSVSADSGTVAPGGAELVRVTLDSAGLVPGELTATLCLVSNDPARPLMPVPVTLTVLDLPTAVVTPAELVVSQPAGTVTGTPLTIGNAGTSPLEWEITQAGVEPAAATLATVDPDRLALLRAGVLLVPDSRGDRVAAFDPLTGDLIDADFIPADPEVDLGVATHVILSPDQDGFLLSEQIGSVIHQYDLNGEYQGVLAPAGGRDNAIMQNVRGIAISPWGTVLATSASGDNAHTVVEFDTDGNFLGRFIEPRAGGISGPWFVLFREDDVLVSASGGSIYRYDHSGAPLSVFRDGISFVQQIQRLANGNVLAASFSGTTSTGVWELDADGGVIGRYTGVRSNRGVHELPNGNILTTNSSGAHEIDRGESLIETKFSSTGTRMITPVQLDRPCDEPGDVPWLSVSPSAGTTPAGGSSEVTVLVDSTGLPAGEHTAHLCIDTNDPDAPLVPVPVTVTVTEPGCDRTISGTHRGPLVVTSGLLCLAYGAEVIGPVTVHTGASIFASGASVTGPVFASGAASVQLHHSRLTGLVNVHASSTAVLLAGNHVTGPVSLVANHTGDRPIVVSGNTVIGPLSCVANQPPPVNLGVPNTVRGPATGQCAEL